MSTDAKEGEGTIVLNEKTLTRDEFEQKKSELEKKPGVAIVEVGPDAYRSRIKG